MSDILWLTKQQLARLEACPPKDTRGCRGSMIAA